ncbi:MAG: hypothetical protein ACQEV7_14330 [Bacillota bacterium]
MNEQNPNNELETKEKAIDSLLFGGVFQAITTSKENFNRRVLLTIAGLLLSAIAILLTIWIASG